MLSLAVGMTSGFAFSAGGWMVSGVLLLVTVSAASLVAGLPVFDAVCASTAVILAFNAGICVGLVPHAVASRPASAG
jgi:hypothetical protein